MSRYFIISDRHYDITVLLYVMELNVREVTTTTDKIKYGAHLVAEPDQKTLGLKLRGSFKSVAEAIKSLTDKQLEDFQDKGEISVLEHVLSEGDLRLMYKVDSENKATPSHYEAHSDRKVVVLVDVTPDQSMLDEGIAREVINRVQKLRKKAELVPSDNIAVYYQATPGLSRIINDFSEFIGSTIKQPFIPYPVPGAESAIIKESTKLKAVFGIRGRRVSVYTDADLSSELSPSSKVIDLSSKTVYIAPVTGRNTALKGSAASTSPICHFVNVEIVGGKHKNKQGTLLLENPRGELLSLPQLDAQVKAVYGLDGKSVSLSRSQNKKDIFSNTSVKDVLSLHSETVYALL
ncbi:hypothetical protein KUTeg_020687 [Tegillarca granosa]|uniref:Isoleucine--tRNA ligase cytoplasmic ubiquitin-like domain-containing protein n=1 Tax=Tegillarca granosa TaxID=220873 RepID=A0ABQ9E969_TEGGR|nr:hypothetical protein KUTeg_020687 [Tegillarca granosa]